MIFGGVVGAISEKLKELILKRKAFVPEQSIIDGKLKEQPPCD